MYANTICSTRQECSKIRDDKARTVIITDQYGFLSLDLSKRVTTDLRPGSLVVFDDLSLRTDVN